MQLLATPAPLFAVIGCLTTVLLTSPAADRTQIERVTRPAISENASPLQPIAPVAQDGHRGNGLLRKPPGNGPFPAVVLIHGGLTTLPPEQLRRYVVASAVPSRFLAAGYVVATITYRSRDVDPQSRVALDDSIAAVEYLMRLPYVNAASVVVFGCSGGGDLAIAIAAEKSIAAIAAEEPASILFTGVFNRAVPKAGDRYTPPDIAPIFENFKRDYYTDRYQRPTRAKIARITSPILIIQGDVKTPFDVNEFNAAVLIPELQSAGKSVQVITYPGEPHCFAFEAAQAASVESPVKAFHDIDVFFRRHIAVQPKALDPMQVAHVPLVRK